MRIAWEHVDSLDVVAAHLELYDFVRSNLAFLDEAVASNNDEEFPLGVVPVFALRDARFRYIDANLSSMRRVEKFGETTARIDVHFQRKSHFFLGQVTQISGIEFFCEGVVRNLGHHQRFGLLMEGIEEFDYLAECGLVCDGCVAVATVGQR